MRAGLKCLSLAVLLALPGAASAQDPSAGAIDEIAKYREMLKEGNPAELWELRGEDLWKKPGGPKNASLEQCDLGKGPGVLKGAYAELPRHFKDTDRVQDLESRLLTCMEQLQGKDPKEVAAKAFSTSSRDSDMEALATYIAIQSNGMPFNVKPEQAKEKEALALGEALFFRRAGTMDFSCATCHQGDGKRIRLQQLMNIESPKQVQDVMASWPTYRVSQGTVRTMQHRMWDCVWQMRLPDMSYVSPASIALITYLTHTANGGAINTPGIKR